MVFSGTMRVGVSLPDGMDESPTPYMVFSDTPDGAPPYSLLRVDVWATHWIFADLGGVGVAVFPVVFGYNRVVIVCKFSVLPGCPSPVLSSERVAMLEFCFLCPLVFPSP